MIKKMCIYREKSFFYRLNLGVDLILWNFQGFTTVLILWLGMSVTTILLFCCFNLWATQRIRWVPNCKYDLLLVIVCTLENWSGIFNSWWYMYVIKTVYRHVCLSILWNFDSLPSDYYYYFYYCMHFLFDPN